MKLKYYVRLWMLLGVALAWESYALNHNTFVSFWALLRENLGGFKGLNLSPEPGKTISLWYGWSGLGLMLLTNLYVVRKRFAPLRSLGRLPGWLDFHIFCGLMGPTLILFHTNFKVGGLVAISFWSMVVSFSSGIVGRYFYMQLVRQKTELEKDSEASEKLVRQELSATPDLATELLQRALQMGGASLAANGADAGVLSAVTASFFGDVRLAFGMSRLNVSLSPTGRSSLRLYARNRRRAGFLAQFQALMGYWHSFHMPFAVFMYVVAAIHIAVALLLKVRS